MSSAEVAYAGLRYAETDETFRVDDENWLAGIYEGNESQDEARVFSARELESPNEAEEGAYKWMYEGLGRAAALGTVEGATQFSQERSGRTHLLDNLRAAKHGSEEARKLIAINAGTALGEAIYKDDYATEIFMDIDENGDRKQFGQTDRSIQRNAVKMRMGRDQVLQDLTQAENNDAYRIYEGINNGWLEGRTMVAISLIPEGLSEKKLGTDGEGFFTYSMTYCVQATTLMEDGRARTQSFFMAGVEQSVNDRLDKGLTAEQKADYREERFAGRSEKRHDFDAIAKLYGWFGQEAPGTAAELLDNPLYIPNEQVSNGIGDLMLWCARATDEVLDRPPVHDDQYYLDVLERSREREARLLGAKQAVVGDLIAMADELESPMDAVKKMWDLIKDYTVEAAVYNRDIDLNVFGDDGKAKQLLTEARMLAEQGRYTEALALKESAKSVASVGGCGGGSSSKEGGSSERETGSSSGKSKGSKDRRNKWPTHIGVCIIPGCGSHDSGIPVEVGPCDICMDPCQDIFDSGGDPTSVLARAAVKESEEVLKVKEPSEEEPRTPVI